MPGPFDPLTLRGTTFPNRVWLSPMCQYSAVAGVPNDWHLAHLGARAVGGFGLVMAEATAVSPEGRISPGDTGLWDEVQVEAWRRITRFIHEQGAVPGVQLAHAGRKASTRRPWEPGDAVPLDEGGWPTVAAGAEAFGPLPAPRALDGEGLAEVVRAFTAAAVRARDAGFEVVEIHAAHGYLLHTFLSPLSNSRTDRYGGDLDGRMRLLLEVAAEVREVWPADLPLFVRISATDWVEGGWTVDDSVVLARALADRGVDLVDCSSGGIVPRADIPVAPGYQVPLAAAVRAGAGVPTAAVGLLTEPDQVARVIDEGAADAVFLARAALRDPSWPRHAAAALGVTQRWPVQYLRAAPRP